MYVNQESASGLFHLELLLSAYEIAPSKVVKFTRFRSRAASPSWVSGTQLLPPHAAARMQDSMRMNEWVS